MKLVYKLVKKKVEFLYCKILKTVLTVSEVKKYSNFHPDFMKLW